jgi:hypothetical protein
MGEDKELTVDAQTAFLLKLESYDMQIADAEVNVAQLKSQKASCIYQQHIQGIVAAQSSKDSLPSSIIEKVA